MRDTWREVAAWSADQLRPRFGESVQVNYYDLLDRGAPPIPSGAQLPLVLVDGEVLSRGGKVSIPAIRKRVESIIAEGKAQALP